MITIGYNQVQEKHVTDSNSNLREDAHEAKKVYVGNKLAHVHVNDNTEFALRQTLNGYIHEDNDLYAKVRSIRGNTKVWNQLVQNPTFGNGTNLANWNVNTTLNYVFEDGILKAFNPSGSVWINQTQISYNTTHVYYVSARGGAFGEISSSDISLFYFYGRRLSITQYNTFVECKTVTKMSENPTFNGFGFSTYPATNVTSIQIDCKYGIKVIDLTLIYGAGNEPTTVAEFEADFQKWFGRPIGAEPYDTGSLIPFVGTGIKSVGFNQWDEEWELGDLSSGTPVINNNHWRSKNFCACIGGAKVCVNAPNKIYIFYYDENKNYISRFSELTYGIVSIPSNACYFKINDRTKNTYNHDICINLSNPTLNGTYVPYKATTVPIPVTTLTGKAEGSTTSEVIFPDGMKSAGSVKDEVYVEDGKTYAIKRVGSVDLGDLSWSMEPSHTGGFYSSPPSNSKIGLSGLVNTKYEIYPNAFSWNDFNSIPNKILAKSRTSAILYCKDTSYTDATTFKAAMSGVMLYYELATPIVYEVDNYTLPLYYPANGTGTEEIQSTATSAPADMDIEYRLRQRVRLVDMGTPGVLWADSDIDITKPDGFCDSPFTYDKSFFSWGNVVGHNPISNTAFDYDWGGVNQAEPWYEGQSYGSTPGSTLTGNIPANATYDAAKAVLGGNWRMPSNAEYGALFSICKFLEADGSNMDTSKTDKRIDMPDGNCSTVKGIYIESTVTGNRLFFSCSGYGNGRLRYSRGSIGYYWSSTWYSARNARNLFFNSGGVNPQGYGSRCYGFALRPVYPISQ